MKKDLILAETSIANLGQVFVASGYFQDTKDAAQAIVKILAGRELGLPPIAAMTGVNIIKGKVSLSATTMAAVLKRHGNYDYRVLEHSHETCQIEFFQGKEAIGISEFTMEDARLAGLFDKKDSNYKKYPRNMLFARAMSNGIRWFCPDILGGPAYTPGELDHNADEGADESPREIDNLNDFVNELNEHDEVSQKVNVMSSKGDDINDIHLAIQAEYPEQGLFEFETREDIQEYLSFLCSDKSEQPLQAVDLFIEPFNQELNDVLVTLGINDVRKVPDEYLIRYGY
jgi:hypothetical protein